MAVLLGPMILIASGTMTPFSLDKFSSDLQINISSKCTWYGVFEAVFFSQKNVLNMYISAFASIHIYIISVG